MPRRKHFWPRIPKWKTGFTRTGSMPPRRCTLKSLPSSKRWAGQPRCARRRPRTDQLPSPPCNRTSKSTRLGFPARKATTSTPTSRTKSSRSATASATKARAGSTKCWTSKARCLPMLTRPSRWPMSTRRTSSSQTCAVLSCTSQFRRRRNPRRKSHPRRPRQNRCKRKRRKRRKATERPTWTSSRRGTARRFQQQWPWQCVFSFVRGSFALQKRWSL
mmetsp:Transcript_17923/g.50884  ORF Transcript_17923/g.50884 Transcript_17923/m.50884 type:complete len:218 (+) Transcript_17923:2070-2723(+)